MCGCSASYANMTGSGNEYIGLTPPAPKYGNAAGSEEKITTTGLPATGLPATGLPATATKLGQAADKAGGLLGQFKSVTDVFTGNTSATGVSEPAVEKKDKMIYLYVIGGLLVLVGIAFAIKKLR